MMVQLPLTLSLFAFVAAFRDHRDAICNIVCIKSSKCIKNLNDSNNLICEDIRGFSQVKCTLVCSTRQSSERISLGEDKNFDRNKKCLDYNHKSKRSLNQPQHKRTKRFIPCWLYGCYQPYSRYGPYPALYPGYNPYFVQGPHGFSNGSGVTGWSIGRGAEKYGRGIIGGSISGGIEGGIGPHGAYGAAHKDVNSLFNAEVRSRTYGHNAYFKTK